MKRLLTIFAVTLIIGFLLPNSALAEEVSPEHQEGYVQQGDGCYYVVSWCKGHEENNSRSIYGEFCFPDSYEEGKTYPIVIFCHQNMGSYKSI